MNTRRTAAAAALAIATALTLTSCTQADRAAHNVSKEAENFNVERRLAVINTMHDTPQLEIVGKFSIDVDAAEDQLEVTIKQDDGSFKKHFVGLGPTVTYVIEDISGADVSAFRYQVSYLPESIIPIEMKDGSK